MKPVTFKHANKVLTPSGKQYSPNVESVDVLPVWTDGEQCLSCWQMSFVERLKALVTGRIWLAVLSGDTQPPACVETGRTYLKEVENGK